MKYTLKNNRVIVIPNSEIDKLQSSLNLSKSDAIDLWLTDNGYEQNEEQEELDKTAKNVKIERDIVINKPKKAKIERKVKVSDEKSQLFKEIYEFLDSKDLKPRILTDNKLISLQINDKIFKIDLIQTRNKAN